MRLSVSTSPLDLPILDRLVAVSELLICGTRASAKLTRVAGLMRLKLLIPADTGASTRGPRSIPVAVPNACVEPPGVCALIYELLDAHADTGRLARDVEVDPDWLAHLDYLRRLQRVGRATLARVDQRVSV